MRHKLCLKVFFAFDSPLRDDTLGRIESTQRWRRGRRSPAGTTPRKQCEMSPIDQRKVNQKKFGCFFWLLFWFLFNLLLVASWFLFGYLANDSVIVALEHVSKCSLIDPSSFTGWRIQAHLSIGIIVLSGKTSQSSFDILIN